MRKQVKIKCQNGFTVDGVVKQVLNVVSDVFDFIESDKPDFILFGPYGIDIPKPGPYQRIGYFCENIIPDLSICDWAFGMMLESEINNPKYKHIQWHNLEPEEMVKKDWDAEKILVSKTGFCNFLYSNPVPYREEFFRQLSKYKKVDAPGKRMNNMPSIDTQNAGGWWAAKNHFLESYKFTISFENYVYPGYQTEKLYDAMLCKSLPIYCGDPNVGDVFNTKSFVNVPDIMNINQSGLVQFLERRSQANFVDILPQYHHSPKDRLQRKLKAIGRGLKMTLKFKGLDFSEVIDRIIAIDKDPALYIAHMQQPWFKNNIVPANTSLRDRWIQIFETSN